MLEERGDNFDGVSADRLKLELPEEMHLKDIVQLSLFEKRYRIAELETKLNTDNEAYHRTNNEHCTYLAEMSQISGSYLVSQRKQMDQLPKMKENLVKTVRCN